MIVRTIILLLSVFEILCKVKAAQDQERTKPKGPKVTDKVL